MTGTQEECRSRTQEEDNHLRCSTKKIKLGKESSKAGELVEGRSFRDSLIRVRDLLRYSDMDWASEEENEEECSNNEGHEETIRKAAVWIRLPGVALEYFNQVALFEIGKKIGQPLKVDANTNLASTGKYARIYIEVDLEKPLLGVVWRGRREQRIEYEGLPSICFYCGRVGHSSKTCPNMVRRNPRNSSNEQQPSQGEGTTTMTTSSKPRTETSFGPWMVAPRNQSQRQWKEEKDKSQKREVQRGNRFSKLDVEQDDTRKEREPKGETAYESSSEDSEPDIIDRKVKTDKALTLVDIRAEVRAKKGSYMSQREIKKGDKKGDVFDRKMSGKTDKKEKVVDYNPSISSPKRERINSFRTSSRNQTNLDPMLQDQGLGRRTNPTLGLRNKTHQLVNLRKNVSPKKAKITAVSRKKDKDDLPPDLGEQEPVVNIDRNDGEEANEEESNSSESEMETENKEDGNVDAYMQMNDDTDL